ncbi:thiol:disulfide interchange protein DsbA/DsbL [Kitasatospora sp. MAP5-34]|uniref:thiol:disulfide interchange protein DsbA/DsbL n=1 Tax=Kitasatospora sp. MAP5-34 TaxID=3035102 RepID=UPI002475649D|nr:thiol:disulfide interchange protein DsbA/DsbL [Kitasatospora sp. MAP5-34]
MNSLLRTAVLLAVTGSLLTSGLLTGPAAVAAGPAAPHESAQYVQLAHPQPVREAAKQEAVEFFWYDCSHSQQLEFPLERWAERHRTDVVLRRVPAVWPGGPDESVQLAHARLYYTLERLGAVDHLQLDAFRAVHDQHTDLTTEDLATGWALRHGLDAAGFRAAYRSPEVDRATKEAPALFTRYEVAELPTVVVQGRYRTGPSAAGGVDQVPAVLDRLVAQR